MPRNANAWLWGEHSPFRVIGGFRRSDGEYGRIVRDSLVRYPMMHLRAAILDSARQFGQFKTGDGIASQQAILERSFRDAIPRQLPAYLAARQQNETIRFRTRVNAAYLGRFYLPGVLAEAMYDASKQAHTAGQWTEVVAQ